VRHYRNMKNKFFISISIFVSFFFFILSFPSESFATRGCCSWHGGVSYCDSSAGRYVCNDGTYSTSCGCTYSPSALIACRPGSCIHDARENGLVQPAWRCPDKDHDGLVSPAWHDADASGLQRADTGAHHGRRLHHQ
jgi:hypothetical protein